MAALNFPSSPSTNDTYTANGITYEFNGTSWVPQSLVTGPTVNAGTSLPGSGTSVGDIFIVYV